MSDCMTFPDSVEEFMEQYKITDTDHVYSNGIEFVPILRMKQWFEHLQDAQEIQPDRMKLVQQAVNTIMNTSRSDSIRDRAFRNAARFVQCAIDGEAPDFEQIPEDDERPSTQPEQTRTFVELVVRYPDPELCTYKEYKGKPYYSIKYIENGETYVGYGTYNPEVLSQYLKEYFISSVQPETKWIPVSERLPEEGCDVLITKEPFKIKGYKQEVIKAKRSVDPRSGKIKWWSEFGTLTNKAVLAWMPLPEPYREEDEQNG